MNKVLSTQFFRKQALVLCLFALSFTFPQFVHATLIGQSVTVTYKDDTPFITSDTVTVGAGVEVLGSDPTKNLTLFSILFPSDFIDIQVARIVIQLSGGGTNMGGGYSNTGFDQFLGARFEFTGFNLAPDIPNGVNLVLTNAIGLTNADVVFTANSLTLNNLGNLGILGETIDNQGQIAIDFQFLSQPTPPTVPEPGTLALLSLGLAALGLRRSRRFRV